MIAVLATALCAGSIATAAQAQLGDVGEQTIDTDLTPVGKRSESWEYVSGAKFGRDHVEEESATPFDLDFFDVSFLDESNGFAVGAECQGEPPARTGGESLEDYRQRVQGCTPRVPVIYRYTVDEVGVTRWEEVYRSSSPGYVGAVAWVGPGRALAVGGTGSYPRRELARREGESDAAYAARNDAGEEPNAAGMGRAWLYESGAWRELGVPAGMRGMSALGISLRTSDCGGQLECGLAGAYRQIWEFRDGGFELEPISDLSPTEELDRPGLFSFRVRDIQFANGYGGINAIAVTSGCCDQLAARDHPWFLILGNDGSGNRWYVRAPGGEPANVFYQQAHEDKVPDNSASPLTEPLDQLYRDTNEGLDDQTGAAAEYLPRQLPDSYYSLALGNPAGGGRLPFTALATPARPSDAFAQAQDAAGEPASQIVSGLTSIDRGGFLTVGSGILGLPTVLMDLGKAGVEAPQADLTKLLTSLRLVSMAGSAAVGSFRLSGQGAVAYPFVHSNSDTRLNLVNPADKGPGSPGSFASCDNDKTPPDCTVNPQQGLDAQRSRHLLLLPSYALNSVDGSGWAVGDHGAILRPARPTDADLQAREPGPPRLGARTPASFPEASSYDGRRPAVSAQGGPVPPLAGQPLERFAEPRFVSAGSPDGDVTSIAMSRDGSEGWAVGSGAMVLYHYEGESWTRCDPVGREGVAPPDRACAALAPQAGVQLYAVARVPLENDDDPLNNGEFEAVAIGSRYSVRPGEPALRTIFRYHERRWSLDETAMEQIGDEWPNGEFTDIAFTAPDDGWIVGRILQTIAPLYHFDGERWIDCGAARWSTSGGSCGDPDRRLPFYATEHQNFNPRGLSLAVAGERVYLFGTRQIGSYSTFAAPPQLYPLILYHDHGGTWQGGVDQTNDGKYNPADGGFDPGFYPAARVPENEGRVFALSAAKGTDGRYQGWAAGRFGGTGQQATVAGNNVGAGGTTVLLRLAEGRWSPWEADDAIQDYRPISPDPRRADQVDPKQQLTMPMPVAGRSAFLFQPGMPALTFNAERERWEALPAPFHGELRYPLAGHARGRIAGQGTVRVVAADNQGGFWATVRQQGACGEGCQNDLYFYHYTDRAPRPVFDDAPHPIQERRIVATAGGADGSFWVATDSNLLYRYDRLTGWDSVRIPGWDPGRASTTPSPVRAIAIGPDGRGIAVGDGGRIADIGPTGARLDPAAGTLCELASPAPPCGTGRDLRTAAVAPDGSAIVAGEVGGMLWRPAEGEFRHIGGIGGSPRETVTLASMPRPDRVYLRIGGDIWSGDLIAPGQWSWHRESEGQVSSIAVDAAGHGYAVAGNAILERRGDGEHPWRQLDNDYRYGLTAVALAPGGGGEALIGGENGVLLSIDEGRIQVARQPDPYEPLNGAMIGSASVLGVALSAGPSPGQAEAWAAVQAPQHVFNRSPAPQALLHYGSEGEPLLDPESRVDPLADAPPPRPGELAFAAFGKQDCQTYSREEACDEMYGSNLAADLVARRVNDELLARASEGGVAFALFTGDINDAPGGAPRRPIGTGFQGVDAPGDRNLDQRRWVELVADPLTAAGVPLLGALGAQDLGQVQSCDGRGERCAGSRQTRAGVDPNNQWRQTMAQMPAPWEGYASGDDPPGELRFEGLESPTSAPGSTQEADTHYAVDAIDESRPEGEQAVARLVFVDTSLGSLAAADAVQEPVEPAGQLAWLEQMLCIEGGLTDTDTPPRDCTREPGQQAIVVSNTPTYTYGPISPAETQADAAEFEAVLLANHASVVVSGRLGWNGRYWAIAPGVHEPCPGGDYIPDERPPQLGAGLCGESAGERPGDAQDAVNAAAGATAGVDGAAPGILPFVVASSAGGKFNEGAVRAGQAPASRGFWRGYSIVRLAPPDAAHPLGDPAKTIVEQRPILDWVGLQGSERTLEPARRVGIESFAREAFGIDTTPRYYSLDTAAITHRYDLLLADPDEPWLPCLASDSGCRTLQARLAAPPQARPRSSVASSGSAQAAGVSASSPDNPCDPYLCLPERLGTIDATTGEVKAGNGKYPDTFAIAMLSVAEKSATYPLVFKRSPSFVVNPAVGLPSAPPLPSGTGSAPPPPAPPNPPQPNVPQPNVPEVPPPPGVPPIAAASPPEPQPPAPPAPPPPTEQLSPLSLSLAPPSVVVATPTAVIQPPTPPVNPAPPGGARREARQRQAAAQKSGADSDESARDQNVDLAQDNISPEGSAMRRHDPARAQRHNATARARTRPEPSFTAISRADDGALGPALLYSGGIALAAALLALGWTGVRPTPRSRPPEVPAPAWSPARRR